MTINSNTEKPLIELTADRIECKSPDSTKYGLALAGIVVFAVLFRLVFFIGFVGADPQDDGIYINIINSMAEGSYSLAPLKQIIAEGKLDPAHAFQLRMAFLVPESYIVRYFGPSDLSFTLFPLLCSICGVILAYCFMSLLAGDRTLGLITAFMLAIYPLDAAFATKISPDVPLGFFIALTVFFFTRGELLQMRRESSRKSSVSYFLAGIFFSLSHGFKVLGVVLPSFLLLYFLVYRKPEKRHLFMILGFIPFFAILSYYYYVNSGDPFLQNSVMSRIQLFDFNAPWAYITEYKIGSFKIASYLGGLFEYTNYTFALKSYAGGRVYYFTVFYHLFLLGAILWGVHYRKHFSAEKNRVVAVLLIWAFAAYLTLEFAPVSLGEIFNNSRYCLFPKTPRFHLYMSMPVVCIGAFCFNSLRRYRVLMYAALFMMAVVSVISMNSISNFYRDGTKDVHDAVAYIKEHPEKTYYTDYLATGFLRYRLNYNPNISIRDIGDLQTEDDIGDAILILGGARGVDVGGNVALEIVPPWAESLYNGTLDNDIVCIKAFLNPPYANSGYKQSDLKMFAALRASK